MGERYGTPSRKTLVAMGKFLRDARIKRQHTQADVAAALGRHSQYVSEVERGARGARMSPLVAVTWAQFLCFDPVVLFQYLGLDDATGRGALARQYLETTMWADRMLRAQRTAKKALERLESAREHVRDPLARDELSEARSALQSTLSTLSAVQTRSKTT